MKTQFKQLPLLTEIKVSKNVFKNFLIVGAQHITESTGSLIEKIIHSGARPEHIFLLGKSYSTDPSAMLRLQKLGVNVECLGSQFTPGAFGEAFISKVDCLWNALVNLIQTRDKTAVAYRGVLILDDGGRVISRIPSKRIGQLPIAAVEQTTKGIRLKEVINAAFPVVSVASSFAKTRWESPSIADSLKEGLLDVLQSLISIGSLGDLANFEGFGSLGDIKCRENTILLSKNLQLKFNSNTIRIGVIGYGHIGHNLITALQVDNYNVSLFDKREDLVFLPNVKVYKDIDSLINNNDIIIGCTGEKLQISPELLKNCSAKIFASGSSEDIEFKSAIEANLNNIKKLNLNSTTCAAFKIMDKHILLASGFPINFKNAIEREPQEKIQWTRALLLGGLIQASCSIESQIQGLTPLNFEWQNKCIALNLRSEYY